MPVEFIIFDCDGVLVDSEPLANAVLAQMATELGCPMTALEAECAFAGINMQEAVAYIDQRSNKPLPQNFTDQFRQRSFAAFKDGMQAIEGVEALLQTLTQNYCVASNGPREKIELNLNLAGLKPYFSNNNIESAYDLGLWKPDPGFYLKVVEKYGLNKLNCVVVEDSRFGVRAAVQAGINVYGYAAAKPEKRRELSAEGAIVFDSMPELQILLRS